MVIPAGWLLKQHADFGIEASFSWQSLGARTRFADSIQQE
jgi:hypothetical protein